MIRNNTGAAPPIARKIYENVSMDKPAMVLGGENVQSGNGVVVVFKAIFADIRNDMFTRFAKIRAWKLSSTMGRFNGVLQRSLISANGDWKLGCPQFIRASSLMLLIKTLALYIDILQQKNITLNTNTLH